MKKILAAAMFATTVIATPFGAAMAAQPSQGVYVGSKYYPPCTSESQDNCVQVSELRHGDATYQRTAANDEESMKKAAKQPSAEKSDSSKAVRSLKERMTEIAPAAGGTITKSNTPHGCSPATTPCSQ